MLAAGRMVSAGGRGWEIMRCIPNCVLTGQAAGTAAALAIRNGTALQKLDVASLQEKLAETGIMIHMKEDMKNNTSKEAKPPRKRRNTSSGGGIATDSLSCDDEKKIHGH